MKEKLMRIFQLFGKNVETENMIEDDEYIKIPKRAIGDFDIDLIVNQNNYVKHNEMLNVSLWIVNEYIRKQKISLSAEKKRQIALYKTMKDEEERNQFISNYEKSIYAKELNSLEKQGIKAKKIFENAINEKYHYEPNINTKEIINKIKELGIENKIIKKILDEVD